MDASQKWVTLLFSAGVCVYYENIYDFGIYVLTTENRLGS